MLTTTSRLLGRSTKVLVASSAPRVMVAVPMFLQQLKSDLSTRSTRGRRVSRSRKSGDDDETSLSPPPPSPVPVDPSDAWTEVRDKQSGMIYWWNTVTNETTTLGAARPTGPTALAPQGAPGGIMQQQQPQSMMGGLGSVLAQGFAFGTGSAVAHNVIGSMFGGSSGGSDSSSGGGDSVDGDSWDV